MTKGDVRGELAILAMLRERIERMAVPVHQLPGGAAHMHVCVLSVLELEWLVELAERGLAR